MCYYFKSTNPNISLSLSISRPISNNSTRKLHTLHNQDLTAEICGFLFLITKIHYLNKISIAELCDLIDSAIESHEKFTIVWHNNKSIEVDVANPFMQTVAQNHLMNFKLWHIEDIARHTDVNHEIIANCKHKIDSLNQKRTDYYELIDTHFISQLANLTNIAENAPKNTESIGMIIDRLSILSLKIYHMTEELNRRLPTDSDYSLIEDKLTTLTHQKLDLVSAVKYLIGEYVDGKKSPMTYKQFKMYNDPTLNPELYNL